MAEQQRTPLQTGFWLTVQEKRYILAVCALLLLGIAARYAYVKYDAPEGYAPDEPEEMQAGG